MKTVYLLRHGTAESRDTVDTDFERKLVKKGEQLTGEVSEICKSRHMIPAVILSSAAPRALETARIFARATGFPGDIIPTEQAIYDQDEAAMLNILRNIEDASDSVMLVGHDPSFSRLAKQLAADMHTSMSKSSVAAIEFDIDQWIDLPDSGGRLKAFVQPEK